MNTNINEYATFGGGCFWCIEAIFNRVEGVLSVKSGYSGGHIKNPAYKEVCTGRTGHAEVVQLVFDSEKITYKELLEIFFTAHNPTTLNRQGNDVGTQYRSVIFHHSEHQKQIAEQFITNLGSIKKYESPIVTQILPFEVFYAAEVEHENYYDRNPEQSYCQFVIHPKIKKFENTYNDKLKSKNFK